MASEVVQDTVVEEALVPPTEEGTEEKMGGMVKMAPAEMEEMAQDLTCQMWVCITLSSRQEKQALHQALWGVVEEV